MNDLEQFVDVRSCLDLVVYTGKLQLVSQFRRLFSVLVPSSVYMISIGGTSSLKPYLESRTSLISAPLCIAVDGSVAVIFK